MLAQEKSPSGFFVAGTNNKKAKESKRKQKADIGLFAQKSMELQIVTEA